MRGPDGRASWSKRPARPTAACSGAAGATPSARRLAGQPWAVTIRKRSWDLPFTINLTKFIHEVPPGHGHAAAVLELRHA